MNEVTQIHLGRMAFTISVDAQRELRKYLDAIQKQVADQEVIDEIELRMAELLTEHGITDQKVILPADIDYLKEQLGNPQDFVDNEREPAGTPVGDKRLFRDTDNAMLAGVAAGLANYFGLNVLFVRILFVIFVISGGWGILLYIVLWLLIPEAKTSSDYLKMTGRPVTIDSLKEVVERADIRSAAQRANSSLAGPVNAMFNAILKFIGVIFIIAGLGMIFGLISAGIYLLMNGGEPLQGTLFPVGLNEHLLLYSGLVASGFIALFIVLFGLATFRQKWPIRGWATGILAGLLFLTLAGSGALAAEAVPNVRDRYNANVHSVTHPVQPFDKVTSIGNDVDINYVEGPTYSVDFKYYDHPNLSMIKTQVINGVLQIDTRKFDNNRHCNHLCIPPTYLLQVTVTSPKITMPDPAPQPFDAPTVPDPNK